LDTEIAGKVAAYAAIIRAAEAAYSPHHFRHMSTAVGGLSIILVYCSEQ